MSCPVDRVSWPSCGRWKLLTAQLHAETLRTLALRAPTASQLIHATVMAIDGGAKQAGVRRQRPPELTMTDGPRPSA